MAELADLEARMRHLEDIEAIKRLKYKYWRCFDEAVWEEMADCFTEDATADYGPNAKFQGKKAILEYLRKMVFRDGLLGQKHGLFGIHHGCRPEINIMSDTTAGGIWAMWEYMIDRQYDKRMRAGVFYYDEYVKESGKWKMKSTKTTNIFRDIWDSDH